MNISESKIRFDFVSEHQAVADKKNMVVIGKVGGGFPSWRLLELNKLIVKEDFFSLFLFNAKKNLLLRARVVRVDSKLPSDRELYPAYYKYLKNINLVFYSINLKPEELQVLNKIYLCSNGKKVAEVISVCRTSCMVVNYEE